MKAIGPGSDGIESTMFRFFLLSALALYCSLARAQDMPGSLTALIEKHWKDISNGKGPKLPFSVAVVMAPDSEELVAIQSVVPKTGETFANSHILMSCMDKSGGLTPTRNVNEKGPKFYTLSGYLSDVQIPMDTGAYESNTLPRFALTFENCDIKDRSVTPDSAVAERNMALINTKTLYPGPTFSCADLSKCSPLAQVIIAESQSSFQLGLADIELVQPYQALRYAKPEDQKALREQASRFAQGVEKSCKLPKKFQPDEAHGNLVGKEKFAPCVKESYGRQRSIWLKQLEELSLPSALIEANRPAKEHFFLQFLLVYHRYLAADHKIDGTYGRDVRNAIHTVQRDANLQEDGFMNDETSFFLRSKIDK